MRRCDFVGVELRSRRRELVSDEMSRRHWNSAVAEPVARQQRRQRGGLEPQQSHPGRPAAPTLVSLQNLLLVSRLVATKTSTICLLFLFNELASSSIEDTKGQTESDKQTDSRNRIWCILAFKM